MQLGHLLTRSGLTYPEVSSKVYHDSFCQSDSSVSLPWVIYFETFYSRVVSSFSCIPVICPKLVLFLTPLQFVHLFHNLSECIHTHTHTHTQTHTHIYIYIYIYHRISVMQLGHLLTRSGLTYPEVPSKVYHDSFCQSDSSVSLPWVTYFDAFYLHVVSSFFHIPLICTKLVSFLTLNSFAICAIVC